MTAIPSKDTTTSGFELGDEQRRAVEWEHRPLMVLAGAGTGKTTVVVERVRHLLATDPTLQPENVLLLTYNVKAAAELGDRLEAALGLETSSRLWLHNFHSFGHRILSEHRAEAGLAADPDVLDGIGQRLLLRELRPHFTHFRANDRLLGSAAPTTWGGGSEWEAINLGSRSLTRRSRGRTKSEALRPSAPKSQRSVSAAG